MKESIKWYLEIWWQVVARPIYFYTLLQEESWKEKSLSFLLITSWIAAFFLSLVIFITQYIPIGSTLIEGIAGIKFVLILPVMITLAFIFFMITLLILGGVMVVFFGAASYMVGVALHYSYLAIGGKGTLNRMLQASFYSSAIFLTVIFIAIFALLTKAGVLDPALFKVGFNLVYGFTALYIYGLWAVAGKKNYNIPRWKAFTGALVPVILLLIFGLAFDKIALSKLSIWITPLK
jgi:hypothetical protein